MRMKESAPKFFRGAFSFVEVRWYNINNRDGMGSGMNEKIHAGRN